MLPSTGLFKAIACPFFETEKCLRPFCHYKHVRKDPVASGRTGNNAASSPVPLLSATTLPTAAATNTATAVQLPAIQLLETPVLVYKPTPKAILAKEQPSVAAADEPTKKRPRLEYVPTPKTTGQNHYGKNRGDVQPAGRSGSSGNGRSELEYKPQRTTVRKQSVAAPEASVEDDAGVASVPSPDFESHTEPKDNGAAISTDLSATADIIADLTDAITTETPADHKHSSTSKDHRSKSSSSHRSRSDRDKDRVRSSDRKDRDRHKDDKETTTDTSRDRKQLKEHNSPSSHRSSSTSKHTSSSSSRTSSSSSHRKTTENTHKTSSSSSSSRDKTTTSSSSSSSGRKSSSSHHKDSAHRHSSSSKGSSTKSSSKSSTSSHKTESTPKIPTKEAAIFIAPPSPSSVFDSDSDEDDVMAQCRMIFDEFKPEPEPEASAIKPSTTNGDSAAHHKKSADEMSLEFDEALRKKRVAYDGADMVRPNALGCPPPGSGKNHAHAAMETVFKRQEIVRIQLEKMEAKKAAEREANDKRLADLEAERVARAKEALKRPMSSAPSAGGRIAHSGASKPVVAQRPVQPPVAVATYPGRSSGSGSLSITPISSSAAAMMRAKQKIEAMRLAKQPTVSRTAPKATGRVAHSASATTSAPDERPPPPVLEPQSTKISLNLRMQYYTLMVKHSRMIYADCTDAWERAQAVELGVFNKCNTPIIYKKSATLAINTLRKEAVEAESQGDSKVKTVSHEMMLGGKKALNTSWSVNKQIKTPASGHSANHNPLDQVSGTKAFDMVYDLRLTDEQLHDNGFPRPADRPGWAQIHRTYAKARPNNENDRYCARCGTVFNVSHFDDDTVVDACNYHAKSPGFLRGSTINAHRCCQQPSGSPGCMYANHHVSDYVDTNRLAGFVRTIARAEDYRATRADIFALDCEMCYTTNGLELTRVTVVNFERKTVYDALVRPDNKVIDYNTVYSGITEAMLAPEKRTLRDVQAVLLSMFHARSVLIGHSLDSDLKALKLIHDVVVDTSVLFPHKLGPPKKRALKTLCIEHLKRIIQEGEAGHDSAEDAEVCIQLVRHYLQNKIV